MRDLRAVPVSVCLCAHAAVCLGRWKTKTSLRLKIAKDRTAWGIGRTNLGYDIKTHTHTHTKLIERLSWNKKFSFYWSLQAVMRNKVWYLMQGVNSDLAAKAILWKDLCTDLPMLNWKISSGCLGSHRRCH